MIIKHIKVCCENDIFKFILSNSHINIACNACYIFRTQKTHKQLKGISRHVYTCVLGAINDGLSRRRCNCFSIERSGCFDILYIT